MQAAPDAAAPGPTHAPTALSTRGGRAGRGPLFLSAAALLLAAGLSLGDSLLAGVVAYERDTGVFYYPLMAWAASQLQAGRLPLWAPTLFGGYPIFADGEIGLAYPPVLLALLTLPPDRALVALRLLHLFVAAVGTYALARAWRLPRTASALAGVTFTLGSFLQAQIQHENVVRTAAWLPLALALAEHGLRSAGRRRLQWASLMALAVGLASLGLHTQILAIDLLTISAYGLGRWLVGPIVAGAGGWNGRLRAVLVVFVPAAILGVGLGAVQLLPLAELARFSPRGSGLSYADSAAYSLTPFGLLQLLFPFIFRDQAGRQWGLWTHWESYLYVGLAPLVLAGLAVARVRRREVWLWVGLGLPALLLALGQYSPLNLHRLLWLAPGFSGLRAPGRFTLVVVLALAMLAAYGLAWLQERAQSGSPRLPDARIDAAPGLSARNRTRGAPGTVGARPWRLRPLALALAPSLALTLGLAAAHTWLLGAAETARALAEAWYLTLPRDSYPLTAADVYAGLLWATDLANPRVAGSLAGLAALGLALYAWRSGPWVRARAWPGWPAALVAATTLDLLLFSWNIHPRDTLAALAASSPATQTLARLVADDARRGQPVRVLTSPVLEQTAPNRLAPLAVQAANGYSSLESRWYRDYLRRVQAVDDDLLDLWNVRYVVEPARYGPLPAYGGVTYLAQNPLLRGPGRNALGDQTFAVPAGFAIAELRVVSALVNAVEVPQDTPVAEVILRDPKNEVIERRPLLAGRDTMEWAFDNPLVQPKVQHQRVEVAGQAAELGRDGRPEPRLLSFARLPFERGEGSTTLEVRSLLPRGEFVLYGAALVDPAGNTRQLFGRQKTKYREVYRDTSVAILENTAAFPRAFLVPSARFAASPGTSLDVMAGEPFDPRREVVLAGDTPPVLLAQAVSATDIAPTLPASGVLERGRADLERYDLGEVAVRVSTPADAFLVLSDTFYPGWRAYVDGQERPLLRGDLLFRVVQVPAGSSQVVFRFEPASIWVGLGVTLASLAAVLGLLAVAAWPARRRHQAKHPG